MTRSTERGYALNFRMSTDLWGAGIIVFRNGEVRLCRANIDPNRPVLVVVEGSEPLDEQIIACAEAYDLLQLSFDFNVVGFCSTLLPFSRKIMAPTIEQIPA